MGGGLFVIPLLGFLFNFDQQLAQGTALAMVIPNTTVALWQYARRTSMDLRLAAVLGASALPFTFAGAHFATHMASAPLRRAFAIFLVALAAYYVWHSLRALSRPEAQRSHLWPAAIPIGAVGGALSGLFSTGGAVFAVPVVAALFRVSQVVAQGMGLALVGPGTLVNLATYAVAGDVAWKTGLGLAIGGTLSIGWGVRLARHLPERLLRGMFAVIAIYSAVALWLRA